MKSSAYGLIARIAAALILLSLCSCMTRGTIGHARMTRDGIPSSRVEQPAYYFLVPLTVLGDVVTFPIQLYLHFTGKGTDIDPWQ